MGLFNIFKKKEQQPARVPQKLAGPTYLENCTAAIENPVKLETFEWRKMLAVNGKRNFRIRYYGKRHDVYKDLIVGTDFSQPLIVAVDLDTNEEILLWDGCKYGYDPIFCDVYSEAQIKERKAENIYTDRDGKDVFEICLSTYNQFDFDEEMGDEVDGDGFLKTANGQKIKLEDAKRNAFDFFCITVINENAKSTEIVSEELA